MVFPLRFQLYKTTTPISQSLNIQTTRSHEVRLLIFPLYHSFDVLPFSLFATVSSKAPICKTLIITSSG
jgi:hypothetical protein